MTAVSKVFCFLKKIFFSLAVQESDRQGEDVVHIKARYNVDQEPREVFFFREGTAVFWNVSDLEISNFLRFIRPFESCRYNERLVLSERELMSYVHGERSAKCLNDNINFWLIFS